MRRDKLFFHTLDFFKIPPQKNAHKFFNILLLAALPIIKDIEYDKRNILYKYLKDGWNKENLGNTLEITQSIRVNLQACHKIKVYDIFSPI